jgi:hypothetical protein
MEESGVREFLHAGIDERNGEKRSQREQREARLGGLKPAPRSATHL